MKDAWARSVNNKDNKPYKDKKYGNKVKGRINAVHYIVYNILRNLPKERGFEPLGEGYETALKQLEFGFKYNSKYWIDNFLYPFEQTVTSDELRELL